MAIFYKKWKKYNEIQLTKKNYLNIRKRQIIHPPPVIIIKILKIERIDFINLWHRHSPLLPPLPMSKLQIIRPYTQLTQLA